MSPLGFCRGEEGGELVVGDEIGREEFGTNEQNGDLRLVEGPEISSFHLRLEPMRVSSQRSTSLSRSSGLRCTCSVLSHLASAWL